MARALQIAHLLLLLAGIAFLGILGWRAWVVLGNANAILIQAKPLSQKVAQTLDAVNRPCGNGQPCGTLATVSKTVVKIGDAVVTTQEQERAITPHTIAAMDNLNRAADALTGTANAATQTLHGASQTLSMMNDSIAATKPLISDSDGLVKQYSLAAPAVINTADNVKRMTADGARITKDAADEADKLAHPAKKKLGFWGGVWVGLTYVHKLMPPIF